MRQAGRLSDALYVERATTGEQRVMPVIDVDAGAVPYFSMIVVPGRDRRLDSAGRSAALRPALDLDHVDGPQLFVLGLGPGGDSWTTPEVSAVLADSSVDLDVTLGTLNQALRDVRGFLHDNNDALIDQVNKLSEFTKVLSDQSENFEQVRVSA